jgi:hypothetical protein
LFFSISISWLSLVPVDSNSDSDSCVCTRALAAHRSINASHSDAGRRQFVAKSIFLPPVLDANIRIGPTLSALPSAGERQPYGDDVGKVDVCLELPGGYARIADARIRRRRRRREHASRRRSRLAAAAVARATDSARPASFALPGRQGRRLTDDDSDDAIPFEGSVLRFAHSSPVIDD